MATETETYKFPKPDEDDFYDIGQFNQTMDLIDESLRAVVEKTAALQSRMSILQEELTQYTDTKISDLIGGAPETLDTLKEVADAIQENDDVVTALTEAIGTKQGKLGIGTFTKNIDILGEGGLPQTSSICWCQSTMVSGTLPYESKNSYWFLLKTDVALDNSAIRSQKAVVWGQENNRVFERIFTNGEWYAWKEYLRTDGDLKDTTVSFTSGDDLNPTGWTAIGKIFSGARLKDILNGFSTGIKNLRFLYKLIGTTDISKIGDGTLTGIVSALNTDIQGCKDYVSYARGNIDKKGWYRIAKAGGYAPHGYNSCVISLKRGYSLPSPEYQKIQLLSVYDKQKFLSLFALSSTHMWTKIRETWDGTNKTAYLEIYQERDSNNNACLVSVEDALSAYEGSHWKCMPFIQTSETVSGVTVLASLDLPANNPA